MQTKFGARFFTPVCHSVHRGRVGFPACITGHMTRIGGEGSASRASLPPGGFPLRQGSASRGVYIWQEGDLPPGGSASRVVGQTPSTATRKAGGTYLTGMFSCFKLQIHDQYSKPTLKCFLFFAETIQIEILLTLLLLRTGVGFHCVPEGCVTPTGGSPMVMSLLHHACATGNRWSSKFVKVSVLICKTDMWWQTAWHFV